MKTFKLLTLSLISLGTIFSAVAEADFLYCYSFYGVEYQTRGMNNEPQTILDNTELILETKAPIINGNAEVEASNEEASYYADLQGDFFGVYYTDETNGQKSSIVSSSEILSTDIGAALFVSQSSNSKIQPKFSDLKSVIGNPVEGSLKVRYLTAQCERITE